MSEENKGIAIIFTGCILLFLIFGSLVKGCNEADTAKDKLRYEHKTAVYNKCLETGHSILECNAA